MREEAGRGRLQGSANKDGCGKWKCPCAQGQSRHKDDIREVWGALAWSLLEPLEGHDLTHVARTFSLGLWPPKVTGPELRVLGGLLSPLQDIRIK